MPKTREFSVRMGDEPGTLGKICRALADGKVNILAFQSIPWEKKSLVRFVVDNPTTAKSVLDTQKLKYTEAEVVQEQIVETLEGAWPPPQTLIDHGPGLENGIRKSAVGQLCSDRECPIETVPPVCAR